LSKHELEISYEFLLAPLTPSEISLSFGTPGNVMNAREAKRRRTREEFGFVPGRWVEEEEV